MIGSESTSEGSSTTSVQVPKIATRASLASTESWPTVRPKRDSMTCAEVGISKRSLLEQLSLLAAQLPHPALVFLEMDTEVAAAMERWSQQVTCVQESSSMSVITPNEVSHRLRDEVEGVLLQALERYLLLSSTDHAALWAVVAFRARLQEQAVLEAICATGCADMGHVKWDSDKSALNMFAETWWATSPVARSGLEAFAAATSSCDNGTGPEHDPLEVLRVEGQFLGLGMEQKRHWMAQTDSAAAGLCSQPGREPNWDPRRPMHVV